jgi:hypothetical protein
MIPIDKYAYYSWIVYLGAIIKVAYSGKFTPKNPKKYMGNPSNIVYRSLWERTVMVKFDEWDDVLAWGSEEIIVPYRSPLDNKVHRYFPDFLAKIKKADGTIMVRMYEVKPYAQTIEPVRPKDKRTSKKFIREVSTYLVNKAKWGAATAYCSDKGWDFVTLTEKELFPKRPK